MLFCSSLNVRSFAEFSSFEVAKPALNSVIVVIKVSFFSIDTSIDNESAQL